MPLENLWFRHDFNARNNPKLLKLKMKMNMEGVGIYWSLIETLYELNGYLKEDDLEAFCFNEHIEMEKVKQVLNLANFQYDKIKGYYSNGVLERINQREEYCAKQKEKADKRWGKQKKQGSKEQEQVEENKEKKGTNIQELFNKVYDGINFNQNKEEKLESLRKLKEN